MRILQFDPSEGDRSGVAVVFCHGFPGTNLNLRLADALRSRGIAPLLFRYSGIAEADGTYRLALGEGEVAAALREARRAGLRVVALGYSLGAFYAVRALAAEGMLADALILLGPVVDLRALRAHMRSQAIDLDAFIANDGGLLRGDPTARVAELHELERGPQPLEHAAGLCGPVLVVWGGRDDAIPHPEARTFAQRAASGRELIVDDDHDYSRSAQTIAATIAEWLVVTGIASGSVAAA